MNTEHDTGVTVDFYALAAAVLEHDLNESFEAQGLGARAKVTVNMATEIVGQIGARMADYAAQERLTAALNQAGWANPVTVRVTAADEFEIVDGHARAMAAGASAGPDEFIFIDVAKEGDTAQAGGDDGHA